jgi:hypothetical protein
VDENRRGGDHRSLVSPATGGAVSSEYVEMLTVGAVWAGVKRDADVLADHVLGELRAQRRLVREAGELVEDEAVARGIICDRVIGALRRMDGVFAAHGIC